MEDFLSGRENYDAYSDFFKYFIYPMGKKTYWKQTIQNASNDQDMTTKSNEAFALLLLENQWDRWLDIFTLNDGKMTSRRGQKRATSESKVMPKYTRGGITYAAGNREDGQKGWSKEGILRFNALYDLVSEDRKKNPEFIKKWLESERENMSDGKRRRKKDIPEMPAAKHELFSDEESMKKEEKSGMELLLSAGQCVGEEQEVGSDEDEN